VWLPFDTKSYVTDWTATPYHELYAHSTDTGADFDSMDVTNVAYDSDNTAIVASCVNHSLLSHTASLPQLDQKPL
jgi:hypothetical protein